MRHINHLAIGGSIYRPHDKVRDRDLREFGHRAPPLIAAVILVALSLGLWAALWMIVGMLCNALSSFY